MPLGDMREQDKESNGSVHKLHGTTSSSNAAAEMSPLSVKRSVSVLAVAQGEGRAECNVFVMAVCVRSFASPSVTMSSSTEREQMLAVHKSLLIDLTWN